MTRKDRYVVKHPQEWAIKKAKSERASEIYQTQGKEERNAKQIVANFGGGK